MPIITEPMVPKKWSGSLRKGQLQGVDKALESRKITPKDFLVAGSTCMVFHHGNGQVIKVTTKGISALNEFKKQSVGSFQALVNNDFKSIFLPINEVIYDDDNYFVYSQNKIRILDLPEIQNNASIYCKILEILRLMIVNKAITPDLISSNLGFDRGQLTLLDYHDIITFGAYHKKDKWIKVIRCLVEFTSWLLYGKGFEKQTGESLLDWKDPKVIKKADFGSKHFPAHFTDMFKAIAGGKPQEIINAITACQAKVKGK